MALDLAQVHAALDSVTYPELGRSLTELNRARNVAIDGDTVSVTVDLAWPSAPVERALAEATRDALLAAGAKHADVAFELRVPGRVIVDDDPSPSVKNIVLVMSGKGGVGKSTVASNLTMGLARLGAKVGLLDADMYGPSVPTMFGVMGRPTSADGKRFLPLERFGVKLMSIGFMLDDDRSAVIWRGPMIESALLQFVKDVDWGELDYLVFDLPPGTGDIVLTIPQKLRTTGAIVVTTPQEVALQDVYKSVSMAQKVGIPILGVVENESYFVCDGCTKRHELFGRGGGEKIAEFASAELLGQLPMDPSVRQWGDAGTPVVEAAPESPIALEFLGVAERLAARVAVSNLEKAGAGRLVIDRSGGTNRRLPLAR